MESSRIRYHKIEGGVTRSRRYFLTGEGKQVFAELNLNDKKFRILDSVTGDVVLYGGDTVNSAVLKIQCKQALMDLGVQFSEENRSRGQETTQGQ